MSSTVHICLDLYRLTVMYPSWTGKHSPFELVSQHIADDQEDGLPAPITALDVVYGLETPPRRGFHKIPVNLNVSCGRGAPCTHLHLLLHHKMWTPVTNIQVVAGKRKEFPIQDGYIKIPKDLNQGAGGKHIYGCAIQPVQPSLL